MAEFRTLNCPMCGAAAREDATKCAHCGSRLATAACPSCFGLNFVGAKFCSRCGTPLSRRVEEERSARHCPRCQGELRAVRVGEIQIAECEQCEGFWVDADSLARIYAERERQAAVLSLVSEKIPEVQAVEAVRYVPCPDCGSLMHRVNFAGFSGVVVDVCRSHGTWFDRDELRRIVEFIQGGGLDKARESKVRELERRARRAREAGPHPLMTGSAPMYGGGDERGPVSIPDSGDQPWWWQAIFWAGSAIALWLARR